MLRSLQMLIFTVLAVTSAFLLAPAPRMTPQCPIAASPALFNALDDALDNPLILEDEEIEPARKCASCMG